MDLDPLSTYEYPTYESYPTTNPPMYPYQVKLEETLYYNQNLPTNDINYATIPQQPLQYPQQQQEKIDKSNEEKKENEKTNDSKESKPVIFPNTTKSNRRGKKNGKNYCSEKINDAMFPFYGCSVCNINYTTLNELDQHVTIHKNRMTSYRLRLKNQFIKKQKKKEKRKLKKLKKIKTETELEIEIKPEDGYIGNEKAAEYNNCDTNEDNKDIVNTNIDPNNTNNDKTKTNEDSLKTNENSSKTNGDSSKTNGDGCKSNDNELNEAEINNLQKIYKCFACQKQFTLSYYLKLHVRSHTDEKPYTCTVCGQSFITASKLGRHNKRIHLAARFQCRICFKIFSRFELLTNHFDKSHPDDKLEGEPYDYNAILPYLKELEEQLKAQAEQPKKEDPWFDFGDNNGDIKEETLEDDTQQLLSKVDVMVEEVKVDEFQYDVKVKEEIVDAPADDLPADDVTGDDCKDDDVKNEDGVDFKDDSFSDEDYFPSNTWAATPKCDPSPPPSPVKQKKTSFKTTTCEICNKVISSASYLRVHMRTHTGEKPFKCYKCGRGFITSSKMNRHVLTHEDGDGVKIEASDIKSEHEDVPTDDEKPLSTSIKKKRTRRKLSKELLNREDRKEKEKVKKKHQKRPHACEYCNQKFLHLNMLEVHKKCHEGEELVYKCHFCLEEAIDSTARKEHESTHVGLKPYLCTICGKSYRKRETMIYHRKHHQPEKEYICDICSKRFNAAGKLSKHLATHRTDKFVLRYECPVCAHMFNTKYHVEMHLATHQKEGLIQESNRNEVLAMVLQNALKIPKQPDAAATLTDMTTSDERFRVCKICGESFHHFYYLEEHLKSHGSKIAIDDTNKQEEKKYICEFCNKAFKLHYYLKLHLFTHSKEKPFMCQQCGKGFITKGKLKRHLETHSGLKKYQCHICYKFFTRPSYLRIHVRTIHANQDFNNYRINPQKNQEYDYRIDKSLSLGAMSTLTHVSDSQNSV